MMWDIAALTDTIKAPLALAGTAFIFQLKKRQYTNTQHESVLISASVAITHDCRRTGRCSMQMEAFGSGLQGSLALPGCHPSSPHRPLKLPPTSQQEGC